MQQINGNWTKTAFKRKNDEVLAKRVKNKPRAKMSKIQKHLMTAFLYKHPNGTVGEFARFHNQAMKEIK